MCNIAGWAHGTGDILHRDEEDKSVLNHLKRSYRDDRSRLLSTLPGERTRGNDHKMQRGKF